MIAAVAVTYTDATRLKPIVATDSPYEHEPSPPKHALIKLPTPSPKNIFPRPGLA